MKARRYHLDQAGADQTKQDRMVVHPVVCVRAHYCLLYQPKTFFTLAKFSTWWQKSSHLLLSEWNVASLCGFYSCKNKLFSRCTETRTLFLIPFNLTGLNSSCFIRYFDLLFCFVNYFFYFFYYKVVFSIASSPISVVPRLCSIHVSAGMQRVVPAW